MSFLFLFRIHHFKSRAAWSTLLLAMPITPGHAFELCDALIERIYSKPENAGFLPAIIDPAFGEKALRAVDGRPAKETRGVLVRNSPGSLDVLLPDGAIATIPLHGAFNNQQIILAEVKLENVEAVRTRLKETSPKALEIFDKIPKDQLARAVPKEDIPYLQMDLGFIRSALNESGAEFEIVEGGYGLLIKSAPKAGPKFSDAKTVFYKHEKFGAILDDLHSLGYEVVVQNEFNPKRPLIYFNGPGEMPAAALSPKKRKIIVRSGAPFHHLLHEYEHVKFEVEVAQRFSKQEFDSFKMDGKLPSRVSAQALTGLMKRVVADQKRRAIQDRGSYNQFLSYSAEVKALEASGYKIFDEDLKDALLRKWRFEADAFYMSPGQRMAFSAKRIALDYLADPIILGMIGAVVGAGAAGYYILFNEDEESVRLYYPETEVLSDSYSLPKMEERILQRLEIHRGDFGKEPAK